MSNLKLQQSGSEQELYLNLLKKCVTASIYDESAWEIVEGRPVSEPKLDNLCEVSTRTA